jgi:hypothetical protein
MIGVAVVRFSQLSLKSEMPVDPNNILLVVVEKEKVVGGGL